jgi:hypothetical protein
VITVLGVFLGWQVNVVRERALTLKMIREAGGRTGIGRDPYTYERFLNPPEKRISIVRRILGDEGVEAIFLPSGADPELVSKTRRLFPESEIVITSQ